MTIGQKEVTLRVRAFLPYPLERAPGQRFRIEQWAPLLRAEGMELTLSTFLSPRGMDVLYGHGRSVEKILETLRGYARRFRELRRAAGFDIALVHRELALLAPGALERFWVGARPMVLDFDDAIYLRPANEVNVAVSWLKDQQKTETLCRVARHVVVGNETLAQHARRYARDVTVVPTTINTDEYQPGAPRKRSRVTVGWSGSRTTVPYLAELREPLLELRRRVEFDLLVIGGVVDLPGLDVKCRPWQAATEVRDLQDLDVGIMPLPDDPWTRGKCGLKALQYMALAIPAVVSPVGVNREIVTDGVDGFHASTPSQWVERLAQLIADARLRARLGAAARATVVTRYSARVHAPRLGAILRQAARRGAPCGEGN